MNLRRFTCIALVIAISVLVLVPPTVADANGVPVKIVLQYLDGYSNWGPTGAAGVAAVNVREGDIRVTATGLPQLPEDVYEGWLINTETGAVFSVGKFNADSRSQILFEAGFDNIPDNHYNLFLISVEPKNDTDPNADGRKTIGGFYPKKDTTLVPAELPKTGEVGQTPSQEKGSLIYIVVGAIAASMGMGIFLGRFTLGDRHD